MMKTIVFFNNKGGVGKTSLVYHLAWMYADMGVSVLPPTLIRANRRPCSGRERLQEHGLRRTPRQHPGCRM